MNQEPMDTNQSFSKTKTSLNISSERERGRESVCMKHIKVILIKKHCLQVGVELLTH